MKTSFLCRLGFIGRFSTVHIAVYAVFTTLFLFIQNIMPESARTALDFFSIYRPLSLEVILVQLLRGTMLALILFPFASILLKPERGEQVLFAALWGLTLFASVEPMPGSFEGIIYTTTTAAEHMLILAAGALQSLLFCRIFTAWEQNKSHTAFREEADIDMPGKYIFLKWFLIFHMATYFIVGGIMYEVSGYELALAEMEYFSLYRPMENVTMVMAVFFGQIVRGVILGFIIFQFAPVFLARRRGWLLFMLLFGLTGLGSPIFLHNLLVHDLSLLEWVESLKIGIPEIFLQMLVFSLLFQAWMRRKLRKPHIAVFAG